MAEAEGKRVWKDSDFDKEGRAAVATDEGSFAAYAHTNLSGGIGQDGLGERSL